MEKYHLSFWRMSGAIIFVAAFAVCIAQIGKAGDWPQFLGKERDGKADGGPELIDDEPGAGFTVAWKKDVGSGFAGPVVADGKAILFHRVGDDAVIQAFDATTGKDLWKTPYPSGYDDDFGFDPGPRSAPTVSDGMIFCYGAEGKVTSLELESGKIRWQVDAKEKYGAPKGFFGRACAPLVVGDLVIINTGGKTDEGDAAIIGLNAKDGKLRWATGAGGASYSSPVVTDIDGTKVGMFFTREGVCAVDVGAGKVLYEEAFRPGINASVSAASPVNCGEGRFFYSASYDLGAGIWQLKEGGKSAAVLWKKNGVLDCHYSTAIYSKGHLFGFHGRQERGQELRCVSVADGSVLWSERMAPGSLIMTGEKLIALTEDGELIFVKAGAEKYEELGRGQILRAGTRAYPALANGFLYARDENTLVCVDLRK